MRIGELSKRTGVPSRMLRYDEEQGSITPRRLDNGYREYDDYLIDRVGTITGLIDVGIPTRIVTDIQELRARSDRRGSGRPACGPHPGVAGGRRGRRLPDLAGRRRGRRRCLRRARAARDRPALHGAVRQCVLARQPSSGNTENRTLLGFTR